MSSGDGHGLANATCAGSIFPGRIAMGESDVHAFAQPLATHFKGTHHENTKRCSPAGDPFSLCGF